MPENPVRSEAELRTGGGWGAPLKADLGPAEIRRGGVLFDGLLARGSSSLGAGALRREGFSARSASSPVATVPPITQLHPGAPAVLAAQEAKPRPDLPEARTVTHLDLRSVAKVSAVFYLTVLIVMVVASVLLWVVADAAGAVHSIDHSVQSLFGVKHYALHPGTIAMYACAAGAVVAVTGTLVNLLAAGMYNLMAEFVGGIRVKVAEG